MFNILIRFLFLVILMFIFDAVRLLGALLVLKIKPGSKSAFKIYAMSAASSFGLFSDSIAHRCNLDKPCEGCKLWTCSKYGKSK